MTAALPEIGDPNADNLHADIGSGPDVCWESGKGCSADIDLGVAQCERHAG